MPTLSPTPATSTTSTVSIYGRKFYRYSHYGRYRDARYRTSSSASSAALLRRVGTHARYRHSHGGVGWLHYYDYLDDDVVESVDYICCWREQRELGRRARPGCFGFSQILQARPLPRKVLKGKSVPAATSNAPPAKTSSPYSAHGTTAEASNTCRTGRIPHQYDYTAPPTTAYARGIAAQ